MGISLAMKNDDLLKYTREAAVIAVSPEKERTTTFINKEQNCINNKLKPNKTLRSLLLCAKDAIAFSFNRSQISRHPVT